MKASDLSNIVASVEAGEGLTNIGTLFLAHKFGERRLVMVAEMASRRTAEGKGERLTALAFAFTQPRAMRPNVLA